MWNMQKQLQDCLESEPQEGRSQPAYSFSGIHGAERKQPLFNVPHMDKNRNDSNVGGLTTLALLRSNPLMGNTLQDFDVYGERSLTCSDDSDIESDIESCYSVQTHEFDIKRPATYFL